MCETSEKLKHTNGYRKIKQILLENPIHSIKISHDRITEEELVELRSDPRLTVSYWSTDFNPDGGK